MSVFNRSSLLAAFILIFAIGVIPNPLSAVAQTKAVVSTDALAAETREFLASEVAAHFGNIKTLQPPPDRVFNALTVGEFSWEVSLAHSRLRLISAAVR